MKLAPIHFTLIYYTLIPGSNNIKIISPLTALILLLILIIVIVVDIRNFTVNDYLIYLELEKFTV